MTKKLPLEIKQSRKPTRIACSFCHSKHLQCDSTRPCKNCTKRGFADTCQDATRKKKGKTAAKKVTTSKKVKHDSKQTNNLFNNENSGIPANEILPSVPIISENSNIGNNSTIIQAIDNNNGESVKTVGVLNHHQKRNKEQSFKQQHNLSNPGLPVSPEISKNVNNQDIKKKKRGRPPKNKDTASKKLKTDTTYVINNDFNDENKDRKTDDNNIVKNIDKDKSDNILKRTPLTSTTDLAGLGVSVTPNSLLLPLPSISQNSSHLPLLNLANASLSNLSLNQFSKQEQQQQQQQPSLAELRLPSFTDLKSTPLFSNLNLNTNALENVKTPQFDLKAPLPTFSPMAELKDFKSNPSTPGLSMLGTLPSLSSTGLSNLLNINSLMNISNSNSRDKDITTQSKNDDINTNDSSNNTNINNGGITDGNTLDNEVIKYNITDKNNLDMLPDSNITSKNISLRESMNNTPINPATPGSPLEFSVTSSISRSNQNNTEISHHDSVGRSMSNRVTPQDIASSGSSIRNFESAVANDEYIKLTDLLNTNPSYLLNKGKFKNIHSITRAISPPMGNEAFMNSISPSKMIVNEGDDADDEFEEGEDDDTDSRPFIIINLENNSMISSYPNNSTPNSFLYNPDHSQIPNTAKQIPADFEEDNEYTSPLIMRHVIKQPDDIYLTSIVKAYRYPKAYHALIAYLKKRFNKIQLLEIAKCMAKYRPSFISATKNLYENDLIFTERSFQRTLLEYENLISLSTSPTIIWRRTGEIVALTNEFAIMTGYSKMSLLSKRTFIVELMDDESTINYFRSFSEFAFGDLNATHLTDCNLRKAQDNNYLRCSCVWTIKRDVFDIPMLIVGQFLPVLE